MMNTTQFQELLELVADRLPGLAYIPAPPSQEIVAGRVSWNQLPRLDLAQSAEIDTWFLSYEARMTAARVPEEAWASRFLECPSVDESLKVRARDLVPLTYRQLRGTLLAEHGPIDPVNFYKRELYRVQGGNREDVRESLMKLLTLHNRAARDDEQPYLRERDLCYPFVEAFPSNIRVELEQKLALVFAQINPFEQLFRLAPSKNQIAREELNCVSEVRRQVEENRSPSSSGSGDLQEAIVLALQTFKRSQENQSRSPAKKRRTFPNGNLTPLELRGSCRGCGGDCRSRESCPARSRTCNSCGKIGHYANVCFRKKTPFQERPASIQ